MEAEELLEEECSESVCGKATANKIPAYLNRHCRFTLPGLHDDPVPKYPEFRTDTRNIRCVSRSSSQARRENDWQWTTPWLLLCHLHTHALTHQSSPN